MSLNRRIIILLLFIFGVAVSFWLVSRYPALGSKAAMSGMDAFDDPMTHEAHFEFSKKAPLYTKIFYTTLNWYETNWRGMVFGLVLAGGFLTLLGYFPGKSSGNRFLGSIQGMFVGTPLGVCVNCVAPIAKGLYEAGSRMETALAVMFSSPTLNIVVLTMLFSIFPFYMAVLKLAATFVLVLLIVPFISEKDRKSAAGTRNPNPPAVGEIEPGTESWWGSFRGACGDYWKSFRYIVVRTAPLMLLAGFLGALLSHLWSFEKLIGVPVNLINLGLISFMGTFMPLPIAFDIMLAQALMMSGMATGFVMTMLFTLGTFSIYSAGIVYQTFSLRLAVKLYTIVFLLGIGLGYIANYYSEYQYVNWLTRYDKIVGTENSESDTPPEPSLQRVNFAPMTLHSTSPLPSENFMVTQEVSIEFYPHGSRKSLGAKPFTKIPGPELGITYSHTLTPKIFFDPLFFGRGIASGDINGDGWTDIAVATHNGFELYQNINGKTFRKLDFPNEGIIGRQGINVALVDLNNDGLLDVFFTAFDDGNFLWLHPKTPQAGGRLIRIPKNNALVTSALAFGDLNRDGYLDIVHGNYFLGVLTRTPIDTSINQVLINENLKFSITDMRDDAGQTHSTLLSDINDDGFPDLMVGNDYLVSDTYYYGTKEGRFRKILKRDGIIPVTTENTMSIDTGDFDNDLNPDIYLANIGFSKGIDVVSDIFGEFMREAGREFCDSSLSTLDSRECHELLKLVTLLNPEKQDISERCLSLGNPRAVKDCMVTRLALLAAEKNNESLCDRISTGHSLGQTLCRKYFVPTKLKVSTEEEIPMRSFSNLLLKGTAEQKFVDVSEKTRVTTAEWSWNARFADLDNDEWQDLYVVNGVLITQEFASNNFFHNQRGKGFVSAEKEFGLEDLDHSSSYTLIDIENDGDLDIVANTLYGPFKVYVNNETEKNSITFQLLDDGGNRFCIGCRIIIHYGEKGERHQMREIKASGGFHSFDAPRAHFGLDDYESIQQISIRWSTGETTRIDRPFPANRHYSIRRKKEAEQVSLN